LYFTSSCTKLDQHIATPDLNLAEIVIRLIEQKMLAYTFIYYMNIRCPRATLCKNNYIV